MIWISILIGALAGVISGMGIGGGTILIPALSFFLHTEQHIAQGVNLLYFIPTAIIALIVHIKNKKVDFKIAIPIILLGIVGAVGGSCLATVIKGGLLKRMFGVFLLAMGLYEFFKKDKKSTKQKQTPDKSPQPNNG